MLRYRGVSMRKGANIMYQVVGNELIFYSINPDFEVLNDCFDEYCKRYPHIHKMRTKVTDIEIDDIMKDKICINIKKQVFKTYITENIKFSEYDIEYDELAKPYPLEINMLKQIMNGNYEYLRLFSNYVNENKKEEPDLEQLYNEVIKAMNITVNSSFSVENIEQVLLKIYNHKEVNRELQYSSGVLSNYHMPESVTNTVKKLNLTK